jgi:hypothetical protein
MHTSTSIIYGLILNTTNYLEGEHYLITDADPAPNARFVIGIPESLGHDSSHLRANGI